MTGKLQRRPLLIFEIDFPRCTRTFGQGGCSASLADQLGRRNKCKNSIATCPVRADFDAGVVTHRYVMPIDGVPKEPGYFKLLRSVKTKPIKVNFGGFADFSTPMGQRGGGTAVLTNGQDNGAYTDPYAAERLTGAAHWNGEAHDPQTRGTHWGKLLATYPNYQGIACRVRRGYVGQDVADMPSESYVVDEITGPDTGGGVTVKFSDVLSLSEGKKALAPATSLGKLTEDLEADDVVALLTPAGVGDAEYPVTGFVRIGREVAAFERTGDVLTLTERGAEGTDAARHRALDQVQLVLEIPAGRACDVGAMLLRGYTTTPTGAINDAEWQAEHDNAFAGVVTSRVLITKPTPVITLLGELSLFGATFWPDVRAGQIRYTTNRPLSPGETFYKIDQGRNLLEGSTTVARGEDRRVSGLLFYHGLRSWVEDASDLSNYNKVEVAPAADGIHEQPAIKAVGFRWFGRDGNSPVARIIALRWVLRFQKPPLILGGDLDVGEADNVTLTARVDVRSYNLEDYLGDGESALMQVSLVEFLPNERMRFKVESYDLSGRFANWMDEGPDYQGSTDQERAEGAFWSDDADPFTFPDGTGPYVYF